MTVDSFLAVHSPLECFLLGMAFLLAWAFLVSLFDLPFGIAQILRDRIRANHCDDLHTGKSSGRCHYNGCFYRKHCPHYERVTLRQRFQLLRQEHRCHKCGGYPYCPAADTGVSKPCKQYVPRKKDKP